MILRVNKISLTLDSFAEPLISTAISIHNYFLDEVVCSFLSKLAED